MPLAVTMSTIYFLLFALLGVGLAQDFKIDYEDDVRGHIANRKCLEYTQSVKPEWCPHSVTDYEESAYVPNVSGKIPAKNMEFPHMAAVGFKLGDAKIRWACGGALISESFVLTAAYCVLTDASKTTWVRVGDVKLDQIGDESTSEQRRVIQGIRHPDYIDNQEYNNIGLLRLESPVPFNSWIRPACLDTAKILRAPAATVTGWGKINLVDRGTSPDLMKVTLPVVDWKTCNASYSSGNRLPNGLIRDQSICAGAKGRDTCVGDGGGPLVIPSNNKWCTYDVVGIVSSGRSKCDGEVPGLYTRVYNYLPWIESVVWN